MTRKILALLLTIALPLPALAQTHVVAELGTAPLIGQVASTEQLQNDVASRRDVFEAAGLELGLTPAEFTQFELRIEQRRVAYVVVPRHLDAMSWRSGGRVHVLRDVVIPARTMGWEVDLAEHDQIVALFIPNKCGNLSLLRKPVPLVARAPQVKAVAVAPTPAPPVPTPVPTAAPAVAVAATPAPYSSLAMSTPSAPQHHFRLWPLLLLPLVALLASHGGHSGPVGITPMPAVPPAAPTPPPTAGCPTPTP